eukprot:10564585-Alexandrium_andersonii.AAC.1
MGPPGGAWGRDLRDSAFCAPERWQLASSFPLSRPCLSRLGPRGRSADWGLVEDLGEQHPCAVRGPGGRQGAPPPHEGPRGAGTDASGSCSSRSTRRRIFPGAEGPHGPQCGDHGEDPPLPCQRHARRGLSAPPQR